MIFDFENRPDAYSYSDGKLLRKNTKRLKSIDVQRMGVRVRAYALTYDAADNTKASRLLSVQQFGQDADVSPAGVTGPASLPPYQFIYSDQEGWVDAAGFDSPGPWQTLDFNGDGRTDIFKVAGENSLIVKKATSTGLDSSAALAIGPPAFIADFNGDGKDDLLRVASPSTGGAGGAYSGGSPPPTCSSGRGMSSTVFGADKTGDGHASGKVWEIYSTPGEDNIIGHSIHAANETIDIKVSLSDGSAITTTNWATQTTNTSEGFDGGIPRHSPGWTCR